MGLLDQVIGSVLSGSANQRGSGVGNSPLAAVLMELLAPQGRSGTQGGLGGLLGGLSGNSPGQQANSGGMGGLGGLLDSLTRSGHGDIADSWVNTGENRPVAPHQLEQALDRGTLDSLSQRTGMSRDELLQQLSEHLPNAVDRLTPEGRRPDSETMGHW